MAYSRGHQRLYLGYGNGAIRYFDVTAGTPVETALTTMIGGRARPCRARAISCWCR